MKFWNAYVYINQTYNKPLTWLFWLHSAALKEMQRKAVFVSIVGLLVYLFTRPMSAEISSVDVESPVGPVEKTIVSTPVLDQRPKLLYFISLNTSSIEAKYPHPDDEKDVLDAYAFSAIKTVIFKIFNSKHVSKGPHRCQL